MTHTKAHNLTLLLEATRQAVDIKRLVGLPEQRRKVCESVHLKQFAQTEQAMTDALAGTFTTHIQQAADALAALAPATPWMQKSEGDRDYSCLMVEIPEPLATRVRNLSRDLVPDDDLHSKGRENWPHITVQYGLHTEDAGDILPRYAGRGPVKFKLGEVNRFHGDGFDVIKIEVESADLVQMRVGVADARITDKHPYYQPHITLAYTKPGTRIREGVIPGLTGREFFASVVVFSSSREVQTRLDLALPKQTKTATPPALDRPTDDARNLTEAISQPSVWAADLVRGIAPVLAKAMGQAMWAQMGLMGVDVRTAKRAIQLARKAKGTKTKASTATNLVQMLEAMQEAPLLDNLILATPYGEVPLGILTEYPLWMQEEIRRHLELTFAQPYWADINFSTIGDIEQYLQQGATDGWSIRKIASQIADEFLEGGDYAKNRARTIARTEVGGALNAARTAAIDAFLADVGGEDLPMQRLWLSVLGTTTRRTHADLDGVPADAADTWALGGVQCRWPGDINLPVGERANCQCTVVLDFGMTDAAAQELVEQYLRRMVTHEKAGTLMWTKRAKPWTKADGCGAGDEGSPGFQPGNTCGGDGEAKGVLPDSSQPLAKQPKQSTLKKLGKRMGNIRKKQTLGKVARLDLESHAPADQVQNVPQGQWEPDGYPGLWDAGKEIYRQADKYTQEIAKAYTDHDYLAMNQALRKQAVGPMARRAKQLGRTILADGLDLKEGLMLQREYDAGEAQMAGLQPGMVISDKALLSTSTRKDLDWGGNVKLHLTAGPGVKGLPTKSFSKFHKENEILLPPNQRILITGVEQSATPGGTVTWKVAGYILASDSGQVQ